VQLSERVACDLELLATGAFSPLDRFMGQADFQRVVAEMRLASGHVFPIPVTLPVEPSPALRLDREVMLRDAKNTPLAVMTVEEIYAWDQAEVAQQVFAPVIRTIHSWPRCCAGGGSRFPDACGCCNSPNTMISRNCG
jgi:sulfate adenylyltransferase